MHFSAVVIAALAVVPAAVYAQQTHTVLVGDGGSLSFNPSNITAQMGDKVAFEFRAKNHTVTQSTFAAPCVPGNFNGSNGADSGFMFISPNNTIQNGSFPTWTITVNTTTPLWFHCAQTNPANHCQKGMVFSINETPQKSFAQYLATAQSFDPSTLAASSNGSASTNGSTPTDGSAPASASPTDGSAPAGFNTGGVNGTDPSASSVLTPATPASSSAAAGASSPSVPAVTGPAEANAPSSTGNSTGKSNGGAGKVKSGAAGLLTVGAVVMGALLI